MVSLLWFAMKSVLTQRLVRFVAVVACAWPTFSVAWGQSVTTIPFAADCILRQQNYLNRTTSEFDKDTRAQIADAIDAEKKSYANVQNQPDPALVVAQIKSHLEKLDRPGLSPQSMQFIKDNLELQESMLCWMDYFARRPYSFSTEARAIYMDELRARQQQEQAAVLAREAARPDDAKTVGRGARGG